MENNIFMKDIDPAKKNFYKLVKSAQCGDASAIEVLIKLVQKEVYTSFSHLTCNKNDIADLTQEVLLKMAKSLNGLKDITLFKAWLNQIVINTFYDYLRKLPKKMIDYDEEAVNRIKDKINMEPSNKYFCSEIENLLKTAIWALPDELRITIVLRELEGLSYSDISKVTNSTIGTVKSRISRARLKLQKQLKEFI